MKQTLTNTVNMIKKYTIMFAIVAVVSTFAWEQVDDSIEAKWRELTTVEYARSASTTVERLDTTSDEEKLITEYKESADAQKLVDAWAKGRAAEDMRARAEQLAEESRADSMSFSSALEQ